MKIIFILIEKFDRAVCTRCTAVHRVEPSMKKGKGSGSSASGKIRTETRGPRVAIRDYRCPEMLINLVLTLGLLLVIKQP